MNSNVRYDDPLDEIYAIRREISERCGHDVDRLFALMSEKQRQDESRGIHITFARLPIVRRTPLGV